MTLTDNGQRLQLHPVIESMISLLVSRQDAIVRRGHGSVTLHYAPQAVALHLLAAPLLVASAKTKDKPRP